MSRASSPTFLPSPDTQRAVTRLERHVEWSKGFWLAYVFTLSPPQAHILQDRVGAKLRGQGRRQRVLRPETPGELEGILADVLSDTEAGCIWVEAIRAGSSTGPEGTAWNDAWTSFILRTNERRELLRRAIGGGLVFVADPNLKVRIRNAGPDLWSVRSFVFELASGPRAEREETAAAELIEDDGSGSHAGFVDRGLLEGDVRLLPSALRGQDEADQARIKEKLATRLFDSGQYDEALEMWFEIVENYRSLKQARSDTYLPNLATSLTYLGACLSKLGRWEEALKVTEEAVAIRRTLSQARPDVFLPDLAGALNNLGIQLSKLGRREEALVATQEAVEAYRGLAEQRPDAFLSDLARSLNNLGSQLSDLGRREEALVATQEAVDIHRGLAEQRPDAFLPDLAMSLNNLGMMESKLGRREEALRATQEAVEAYRGLAEQRPSAFLPDLAMSLNNLGMMESNLGRREEALRATQEAVEAYRGLAEQRPDALLPNLANALWTLGLVHLEAEDYPQAMSALVEGLRSIRPSFEQLPQAFGRQTFGLIRALRRAAQQANLPIPEDLAPLLDQLPPDE